MNISCNSVEFTTLVNSPYIFGFGSMFGIIRTNATVILTGFKLDNFSDYLQLIMVSLCFVCIYQYVFLCFCTFVCQSVCTFMNETVRKKMAERISNRSMSIDVTYRQFAFFYKIFSRLPQIVVDKLQRIFLDDIKDLISF